MRHFRTSHSHIGRAVALVALAAGTGGGGCDRRDHVVAVRDDGGPPADAGGGFGAPVPIPLLAPGDLVQDPTLTGDELELYFASTKNGDLDIWATSRAATDRPWEPARRIDELSTTDTELEPELSPDGLTLYLCSDRAGPQAGLHVWFSQRSQRTAPWGVPQPIALGPSTADRGPAVSAGGLTMVFASTRETPDYNLYLSVRPGTGGTWGPATALGELNTIWYEWDPALFDDGRAIVFGSRRQGDHDESDLFQARRETLTSPFASVQALPELNTPAAEGDPWLSNDGRHIVFASERDGVSRIYEAWR